MTVIFRGRRKTGLPKQIGQAIDYLRAQGVQRIWLFGSAAKGSGDWRSDLDLAVEGLEPMALGRTWSELDALLDYPVDLIRWEEAGPELRSEILPYGKLLHEV